MRGSDTNEPPPLLGPDELRLLVGLLGSPLHKVLQKVLNRWKHDDSIALLDKRTDHPTTQYHRGRLSLVGDFVLLLEKDAPNEYERVKKSAKEPST